MENVKNNEELLILDDLAKWRDSNRGRRVTVGLHHIIQFQQNGSMYPQGAVAIPFSRIIMVGTVGKSISICARTSRLCSNCGGGSVKLVSTNLATTSEWWTGRREKAYPIHSSIGGRPSGLQTSGDLESNKSSSISYRRGAGVSITEDGIG